MKRQSASAIRASSPREKATEPPGRLVRSHAWLRLVDRWAFLTGWYIRKKRWEKAKGTAYSRSFGAKVTHGVRWAVIPLVLIAVQLRGQRRPRDKRDLLRH